MSDTDNTPAVSDEEVAEARDLVQERREELARLNSELVSSESSRNNSVRKGRLDREAESLEQQIENARRRLELSQDENTSSDQTSSLDTQAHVIEETGEVNPDEVERYTDTSDLDEE